MKRSLGKFKLLNSVTAHTGMRASETADRNPAPDPTFKFTWGKTWKTKEASVIADISKENQKKNMFLQCVLKDRLWKEKKKNIDSRIIACLLQPSMRYAGFHDL